MPRLAKIVALEPWSHVRLIFNDGLVDGKSITLTRAEFESLMYELELFKKNKE
jgi:hypothetical protein